MSARSVDGLTGEFWRRGETGFDDATTSRLFNHRRPSRSPAAVLRAADTADVIAGVRLAAAEGWKVAVRAGGHSWDAWSLREGSLLIDLARFTGMAYDPATGIVAVGPAVRGGMDLDPYLARHGRFFAVGHSPTVGMGGFLLQGGVGWNCRGWGWAAESIESMDVVTATGELVRCSMTENADLFWAARGAGPGFFGVVTEFRLRTHPRFGELTQSTYAYPADLATEVLSWYHTARHDVPPSVELAVAACTLPGSDRPAVIIDAVSFDGGPVSLASLDGRPATSKAQAIKVAQPVELADLFADNLRTNPDQSRYFTDNAFLTGSSAELVAALVPAFTELPTSTTFTVLGDFSPLWSRQPPDMAISLPSDLYFAAYVIGETADEDAECRTWLDGTMDRVAPHSAGCYLGDSDLTVRPDRIMSDAAWAKIQQVRAVWDPEGRFPGYLGTPMQHSACPPSAGAEPTK